MYKNFDLHVHTVYVYTMWLYVFKSVWNECILQSQRGNVENPLQAKNEIHVYLSIIILGTLNLNRRSCISHMLFYYIFQKDIFLLQFL